MCCILLSDIKNALVSFCRFSILKLPSSVQTLNQPINIHTNSVQTDQLFNVLFTWETIISFWPRHEPEPIFTSNFIYSQTMNAIDCILINLMCAAYDLISEHVSLRNTYPDPSWWIIHIRSEAILLLNCFNRLNSETFIFDTGIQLAITCLNYLVNTQEPWIDSDTD